MSRVPPTRQRHMNPLDRALENFAKTRAGGWLFVNVFNRIDPYLLKASGGRLSLAVGQPILLLKVRGAKSGQVRETPLLYATDLDRIVLVASNAGSRRHPLWYRNITANPDVDVLAPGGRSGRYRAREVRGAEKERLWAIVNDLYTGYETYQQRAGDREIPVIALERA